jgi:hypothetical protein
MGPPPGEAESGSGGCREPYRSPRHRVNTERSYASVTYPTVGYGTVTYTTVTYGSVTYSVVSPRELTNMDISGTLCLRGCGISQAPGGEPAVLRARGTNRVAPGGLSTRTERERNPMIIIDQIRARTRKTVTRRVLEPVITLIAIAVTLFLALTAVRSAG